MGVTGVKTRVNTTVRSLMQFANALGPTLVTEPGITTDCRATAEWNVLGDSAVSEFERVAVTKVAQP